MDNNVKKSYELAREAYASIGVDTDKVLEALKKIRVSVNCWQGDDVNGFLLRISAFRAVFRQRVTIPVPQERQMSFAPILKKHSRLFPVSIRSTFMQYMQIPMKR